MLWYFMICLTEMIQEQPLRRCRSLPFLKLRAWELWDLDWVWPEGVESYEPATPSGIPGSRKGDCALYRWFWRLASSVARRKNVIGHRKLSEIFKFFKAAPTGLGVRYRDVVHSLKMLEVTHTARPKNRHQLHKLVVDLGQPHKETLGAAIPLALVV